MARGAGWASNKDFEELHQAWVLVELFLQSQVLQWSQLLVSEIRGKSERTEVFQSWHSSFLVGRPQAPLPPHRLSRCSRMRMRNMA